MYCQPGGAQKLGARAGSSGRNGAQLVGRSGRSGQISPGSQSASLVQGFPADKPGGGVLSAGSLSDVGGEEAASEAGGEEAASDEVSSSV